MLDDTLTQRASIEFVGWPRASEWLGRASMAEHRLVVAGVPLSEGAISAGSYDLAPKAVRDRLVAFSTYDAEHDVDLLSLPVVDLGDDLEIPPLSAGLTILIGGHNGVTWRALSGQGSLHNWGLLTMDTHHDARPYTPGHVGNGSPVRALIDAGLPGSHVIQVGIHGFSNSAEHRRWCVAQGITILDASALTQVTQLLDGLADTCDHIYVDIDLDVLDRAFAPACSGSRPGGASAESLTEAAHAVGRHKAVRAVDIVELDPTKDVASVTTDCAALTLLTLASGYARR